jgi:hypothetical protein
VEKQKARAVCKYILLFLLFAHYIYIYVIDREILHRGRDPGLY